MRILQAIQFFSPNHGGSAAVPYELSKQLQDNNEITIVTTDYQINDGFIKNLQKVDVKVFHCYLNLFGLLYSPKLKDYIRNNITKFDIIHMHNYRTYQNIIIYKYAKKNNIPYIIQAHGSTMPFYQKILFKRLFDFVVGNKILRDASRVIAITQAESEQYKKMGVDPRKIEIIPNGINASRFNPINIKGAFKRRLGIDNNTQIILFVGRIHKIKGIDFLLKSYNQLCEENNNVLLLIIGPDNGYKTELLKLVKELNLENKVMFLDYLESVSEVYADADVVVYPSVYEVFGLVPLEAIICNTPVIITENCGCLDILKQINYNYSVKYGDIPGLKDKIKYVLVNPDETRIKIGMCRDYIITNVTWNKIAIKMEHAYADCIRNV